MSTSFKLTPSETVTVLRHDDDLLEVEGRWGPAGKPPPPHLHPAQDERFEVLEGRLNFKVDGDERELASGETLEIPNGTSHQVWNAGTEPARAIWQTRPAGRTAEWFAAVDALHSGGKAPGPLDFAPLLTEYDDVFRLSTAPQAVMRPAVAALGALGRIRGRARPSGRES